MKRRLWALLWVLSLLLCVATMMLWVRSHFKDDSLGRYTKVINGDDGMDAELFFESGDGRLYFGNNWHQYHLRSLYPNTEVSEKRWKFLSADVAPGRLGPAYFPYNV